MRPFQTLFGKKNYQPLDEQRERYGHWVYQDREVLREKHKNDRLAYEKEKDHLRKITGEKFFESLELSVRHTTALASGSPAFERMWHFWGNFFAISEKDFLASFSTGVYQREVIRPNMVNTFRGFSVCSHNFLVHASSFRQRREYRTKL